MDLALGGMPGPRTCMLLFPNPTLIAMAFCRCWNNGSASRGLHEPPYTEPYVRWCGRTAEVTPPPTRLVSPSLWEGVRERGLGRGRVIDFLFAFCVASTQRIKKYLLVTVPALPSALPSPKPR